MTGITRITDDIVQVQIPLPFALSSVNCYLLRGEAGWTLVDAGLNTAAARSQWKTALNELDIRPANIEKIVLTHLHPDHFGLAGWWQRLADEAMPLYLPAGEQALAAHFYSDDGAVHQQWLRAGGMDERTVALIEKSAAQTRAATQPHPIQQTLLAAERKITLGSRTFDIIHAPGHSDGQLIFYDPADALLLCGDHVLMKITPNVGLWPHTEPNPLGRFLESLNALRGLDVRLALPGHKALIGDWRGRIEELCAHHETRLCQTLAAIEPGAATAFEVAERLFNNTAGFTAHEWRFALAEAAAHLELLQQQGRLRVQRADIPRYQLK